MAGPIQTAIGSMLNTVSGALAIGKKLSNDERQASEKASAEAKAKAAQAQQRPADNNRFQPRDGQQNNRFGDRNQQGQQGGFNRDNNRGPRRERKDRPEGGNR